MNYKLRIKKRIHSCFAASSTDDIMLHKDFELPFVPFADLIIYINNSCFTANGPISWDVDKAMFVAYESPDRELYDAHPRPSARSEIKERIEKIAANYIASGWERE